MTTISPQTRYPLREQLSQRDLATIYFCIDTATGQPAYIALPTDLVSANRSVLSALRVELPLLQNADPALLTVLDYNLDTPPTYIVTEPLEGCSLRQLLESAGKGLMPTEALAYCAEAARCIQTLHNRGTVHGSITIDTFVLRSASILALTPWIFEIFGPDIFFTSDIYAPIPLSDRYIYTPPERANTGNTSTLPIVAGDIYALGILLFHLLTGNPPGVAPGSPELAAWLKGGQTPPLRESVDDATLRVRLAKFIQVATHSDPMRRWPDLKTFVTALEQIKPGGPVSLPRIAITPRRTGQASTDNGVAHGVQTILPQSPTPTVSQSVAQSAVPAPMAQQNQSQIPMPPVQATSPPQTPPHAPAPQPHAQPRTCYLVSHASGSVYPINAPHASLGIARTTDFYPIINLATEPPDVAQFVSQYHADLIYDSGQWYIQPHLQARNPTFMNGEQLNPGIARPLVEGAILELPALRLEFRVYLV